MNQKGQLSVLLSEVDAPRGLYGAIVERVLLVRRRAARVRVTLLSMLALFSGAMLVPALQYTGREFYASGFYDYASLLSSDRGFVLSSWHEIAYSLLESLPSIALLLLLAITVALVWSLRKVLSNARVAFRSLPQNAY